MIAEIKKRFTSSAVKGMLLAGAFLGVGALPCPDCGTPLIFHIWPIAGLLVVVQGIRNRKGKEHKPSDPINGSPVVSGK
jgi:hypothetical protein